jgi:hypothetical protein
VTLKGNARLVFMVITIHDGTLPHIPKWGTVLLPRSAGVRTAQK